MYSAAVSLQLRGDPPATGNLSPIKFEARREGIIVSSIHEAGHFLVGYLLGVLPKGLQDTKHRSSEAGEVRCSKSRVYGFSSSLKK
ncbi:hypothetical protein Q3G72_000428 [Acer saccharum]|nr:hypothetical protein Q3G72_000428 [Acer saccharum]